jgi:hypothetical protein
MAVSGIAALIFMALPFVVVPLRRRAGFATHQWDGDPATSYVRSPPRLGLATAPLPQPSPHPPPRPPLTSPAAAHVARRAQRKVHV